MWVKYKLPAPLLMIAIMLLSGCFPAEPPTQPPEPEANPPLAATFLPTATLLPQPTKPPPTFPPTPTQTASLKPPPTLTLTPLMANEFVERLCPELHPPLGLFSVPEPSYDSTTSPETLYAPFQIIELSPDALGKSCTLYLSPPPMGVPQFAGGSLYWQSFDFGEEWIMIWKYDPATVSTDNHFPQHVFLRQTRTSTPLEKAGLFDFVVADDGATVAWSFTDPHPYSDTEMGFAQELFGAATSGPIDQRPPVDIWSDFVPEGDSGGKILRPRELSSKSELVYYSIEPVGLGTQWPEPRGKYSSLYSLPSWGDWYATPKLHFDCGQEYWCISDFSEAENILVSIQENHLLIVALDSRETIRAIAAPEDYPIIRQAVIGPGGIIAFYGAAVGEVGYSAPPESAAIFLVVPPYQDDPIMAFSDPGLLNMRAWASPTLLLADGTILDKNASADKTGPVHLTLINIETREGIWLPFDADLFVSLLQ